MVPYTSKSNSYLGYSAMFHVCSSTCSKYCVRCYVFENKFMKTLGRKHTNVALVYILSNTSGPYHSKYALRAFFCNENVVYSNPSPQLYSITPCSVHLKCSH